MNSLFRGDTKASKLIHYIHVCVPKVLRNLHGHAIYYLINETIEIMNGFT